MRLIEKRIKNVETLKKWKAFKNRKLGYYSAWIILIACFFREKEKF